jgi:uncharacterized protein DUF4126
VEILNALGRTIPFAFASGLNLYATVAVLGICSRYNLVSLPDQFQAFGHPAVIIGALALYLIEFVADKVPWVDSAWDVAHTVVRPVGGALVAVTAMGASSPGLDALAALLGASVAMTTHLTKTGTGAAANTTPEPFSNWALSLVEDLFAVGLTYVALQHPILALTVAVVLLVVIAMFATLIIRAVRRRFAARRAPA